MAFYGLVFLALMAAFFTFFAIDDDGNALSSGIRDRATAQLWALVAAGAVLYMLATGVDLYLRLHPENRDPRILEDANYAG